MTSAINVRMHAPASASRRVLCLCAAVTTICPPPRRPMPRREVSPWRALARSRRSATAGARDGRSRAAAAGPVRLEHAPRGGAGGASARPSPPPAARTGSRSADSSGAFRAVSQAGIVEHPRVTVVARLAGHARRHVRRARASACAARLAPGFAGRRVRLQLATGGAGRPSTAPARAAAGASTPPGARRCRPLPPAREVRRRRPQLRRQPHAARARERVPRPARHPGTARVCTATQLGCGGTLTPARSGVANRRLPCGTRVTLRYRGRSVTVP